MNVPMSGWSSLILGWTHGFGFNGLAVMSWCWNDPTRVSLKVSFFALCREIWLHRMLSCGNTLLWDRHSKGLPDMLRSSSWDFGFVSSSWWAHWTQPAGTESNECLIADLVGAEVAQTVRAEQISLERFPGMKSIKAEIILVPAGWWKRQATSSPF